MIPNEACGVNEEMFPCTEKCCSKNYAPFMASYEKTCPHCDILTSLPYGASLRTVTIFECGRLGYGRKLTE